LMIVEGETVNRETAAAGWGTSHAPDCLLSALTVYCLSLAAPMAFHPNIASGTWTPVAGNPAGTAVRWLNPMARNPDVTDSVPAMEAGLPDPAGVWGGGNNFNGSRWRWSDTDDYLSSCSKRCGEENATGNCE